MTLPDLKRYRVAFEANGTNLPLQSIEVPKTGLLKILPSAPEGKSGWPWTEETAPSLYNTEICWPRITIVTPTYQQGNFLEETIRSVLLQNYPNLEYIIIDGGSNDQTRNIIERYAPWISFWQSKKDNGQGQAINMGFSLGSGQYYAWINSDDHYLNNVFHLVVTVFLKTHTKFVYGFGLNYQVDNGLLEMVKILPFWDYFIKIPTLIQPSTFWDAGIHQPIWEELHCSLDFELWLRLVKGNKRRLIRQPLSVAKVHSEAKTVNPKMQAKWQEDHEKIWSAEAHGEVYEWKRINFLNRIRFKVFKFFKLV
ncbi:glycosyltransferase family 2 protein [Mucilaginibacter flavidus]|uniref:glycosyltransferase family 2 protein n=1 Tax=Mucilaginibacter flavidus TaxID=2949309 RepID=UPI00209336F5|nr:glycosyltransferase family 2 protein [Mucilaginibacter flavidus]MCO5947670.1 glycosyltransferase [Mucilaginibacter flavidus]